MNASFQVRDADSLDQGRGNGSGEKEMVRIRICFAGRADRIS